jgi:hypothetical protein
MDLSSRAFRTGARLLTILLSLLAWAPNFADPDTSPNLILTLAPQFVGTQAATAPANLRNCGGIPGGATADLDGWIFSQPVAGGGNPIWIIGYLTDVDTNPTAILIGVDASGVVRVPIPPGAQPLSSAQLSSQLSAVSTPSASPTDGGNVLPPGVAGGLLNGGADGAWLRTPAGWMLLAGALRVDTTATDPLTFDLTAVCAPSQPTPSPSTSAAASPTPTPTSTIPGMPVTGEPVGRLAAAGLAILVAGATLVVLARRRNRSHDGR